MAAVTIRAGGIQPTAEAPPHDIMASLKAIIEKQEVALSKCASRPILLPRRHRGLWWLASLLFRLPDPPPLQFDLPLNEQQIQMIEEERLRSIQPGYLERLSMDRQFAMECLRHFKSLHPGTEYEPAPGMVTLHSHFHDGICWTHGNFVARQKRSGCLSFLPAPRTLFFFELACIDGFDGVVTCTPLLDEPVTEAYSILGFPLWWSARRSGSLKCFCETCHARFDVPHLDEQKVFACGHDNVKEVCEMCYRRSGVLHPGPEEFAFGYHDPYRSC